MKMTIKQQRMKDLPSLRKMVCIVVVAVVGMLGRVSFYIHSPVFSNSMWQYSLYFLTYVKCNVARSLI